jgi:hypothetical protein
MLWGWVTNTPDAQDVEHFGRRIGHMVQLQDSNGKWSAGRTALRMLSAPRK